MLAAALSSGLLATRGSWDVMTKMLNGVDSVDNLALARLRSVRW